MSGKTDEGVIKRFRISWTAYFALIVKFAIVAAILLAVFIVLAYKRFGETAIAPLANIEILAKIAKTIDEWTQWISAGAINIAFWVVLGFITLHLLIFIYRFLFLRSVYVYTNKEGVWLYRGILPWQKGSYGVKWRDLDSAVYFSGFKSWIFKTYDIRIDHRFTKDNEIALPSVFNGHKAVAHINQMHQEFIGAQSTPADKEA
ncbi:MAG: hypothetical protein LBC09_04640 [Helicobacteraceae bacterium]|jgi:hypothetical protein|nr:hypothetical protein [Helicobacteraceae bacterium]